MEERDLMEIPTEKEPEKEPRVCSHCGFENKTDARYCNQCGAALVCPHCGCESKGFARYCIRCGTTFVKETEEKPDELDFDLTRWVIGLIAIIFCAVLWIFAPLVTFYYFQLSTPQLLGVILYAGELPGFFEFPLFWTALLSLVGIIICFVVTVKKSCTATRITAILTEILWVIAFIGTRIWVDDDVRFGIGFWGIFILLLVVIFASGKNRNYYE